VELLTVLGVILLLAGLLLPVLRSAQEKSRSTYCKNNLKGIGQAVHSYLGDSEGYLPVACQLPSAELNNDPPITDALADYLSGTKCWKCPSDNKGYYKKEGTSYEYNSMGSGRMLDKSKLAEHFGIASVFLMYDYEPFHGKPGTPGAVNYLFADGHVGDMK
jgi:prepilin-type processing-associated H-X9-DG protein